jgi:ABC-type protease/lipase transport system fused ATPase/permease subunit
MKQFFKSLFSQPRTATLLLISSLLITTLALVPAFYVILVLNKFLSSGVISTLVTLTVGAVLCILFEYVFRQNRQQLLSTFLYKQSHKLLLAMKEKVQQEKQMPMEVSKSLQTIDMTNKSSMISGVLDAPFQLVFFAIIFAISWQIGLLVIAFVFISWTINHYNTVFNFKEHTTTHLDMAWTSLLTVCIISLGAVLSINGQLTVGGLIGLNILSARTFMTLNKYFKIKKIIERRYESFKELEKYTNSI